MASRYNNDHYERYDRRDGRDYRDNRCDDRRDYKDDRRDGGYNNHRRNKYQPKKQNTYQTEISKDKVDDFQLEPEDITLEEREQRQLLVEKISSFEDLGINMNIMRGIFSHGFELPSPIQQVAIRPMITGLDIIAQAQSGLGKTATFCIGALSQVSIDDNTTQIIILSHTREMASQIWAVMTSLNKYFKSIVNLSSPSISQSQNAAELRGIELKKEVDAWGARDKYAEKEKTEQVSQNQGPRIPQIVIGTPGRILDMIKQGALQVNTLKSLILDEADELLGEGFQEQIRNIITNINTKSQIALFSATYNTDVLKLTKHFMNRPIHILVKNEELTLEGIKQYYVNVLNNQYKFETLCDIYSMLTISQTIIFCNSQRTVEYLSRKMRANNFTVASIHGDMSVVEREQTMSEFRNGTSKVLIATDVIGRGIDVQSVSIVINYELPIKISNYIHRIGRSGRYGRKGCGISFVCEDDVDVSKLKQIQSYYQTEIRELPEKLESILV
jgi:translation initiation factor 4A